jgi:hypothetical protein
MLSVRYVVVVSLLMISSTLSASQNSTLSASSMLAQTAGRWQGELQYRDYQSNTWQSLPMSVAIVAQPDNVTTVRTANFDDGPQTGIVTITTVMLVDPAALTLDYAIFRRNRPTDVGASRIVDVAQGADAFHWSIVTVETRKDGNEVAQVRETTTQDGELLTTLKEVNPAGDNKEVWLPRNRSVLRRTRS